MVARQEGPGRTDVEVCFSHRANLHSPAGCTGPCSAILGMRDRSWRRLRANHGSHPPDLRAGSLNPDVGYLAAFGGGIVSFLSPCVLPLVPAYLTMLTGLEASEIESPTPRQVGLILRDTGMFIAGFATVFILLGLVSTSVGQAVFRNHVMLTRISGAILLAMACFLAGSMLLRAPWLYQEKRFHPNLSRFGPLAAPIAGAAFGFGWTPCIGPILSSVLAVAATQGQAGQGAVLLAVYSAGLGVPFLATGLAAGRLSRLLGLLRRHLDVITLVAALLMAGFGVLLLMNRLVWVTIELEDLFRHIGLGKLITVG